MSAPRPYDVIAFDCYGTLIDWDGGIAGAFARALSESGSGLDPHRVLPARVLEIYEEIEAEVEAERYRSYREVLTESARRIARRLGRAPPEANAGLPADSPPRSLPLPDTNPA